MCCGAFLKSEKCQLFMNTKDFFILKRYFFSILERHSISFLFICVAQLRRSFVTCSAWTSWSSPEPSCLRGSKWAETTSRKHRPKSRPVTTWFFTDSFNRSLFLCVILSERTHSADYEFGLKKRKVEFCLNLCLGTWKVRWLNNYNNLNKLYLLTVFSGL